MEAYKGTWTIFFVYRATNGQNGYRFLIWQPTKHDTAALRLTKRVEGEKRRNGGFGDIPQSDLDAALVAVPQAIMAAKQAVMKEKDKTEDSLSMSDFEDLKVIVDLEGITTSNDDIPF